MNTPTGGNEFLHELKIEVRKELTLAESSRPQEARDLPIIDWLFDPVDAEHGEVGLRGLIDAIEALENGFIPNSHIEDGHP